MHYLILPCFVNRARGGSLITLSCPLGTKGEARWKCSVEGDEWESPNPDLSGCRSIWLLKIHDQLKRKAASVVHLAKVNAHCLFTIIGNASGAQQDLTFSIHFLTKLHD